MSTDFQRIKDPARREHYVYRLLAEDGGTLYIGCSMSLRFRLNEHRRNILFGHQIQRVRAYGPYNYGTARALERQLISAEQPPHNIEWTSREERGVPFHLKRWSA